MKQIDLVIEGMSCGHCIGAVKKALESSPHVLRAEVELGRAHVEAADAVTLEQLLHALDDAGYAAQPRS